MRRSVDEALLRRHCFSPALRLSGFATHRRTKSTVVSQLVSHRVSCCKHGENGQKKAGRDESSHHDTKPSFFASIRSFSGNKKHRLPLYFSEAWHGSCRKNDYPLSRGRHDTHQLFFPLHCLPLQLTHQSLHDFSSSRRKARRGPNARGCRRQHIGYPASLGLGLIFIPLLPGQEQLRALGMMHTKRASVGSFLRFLLSFYVTPGFPILGTTTSPRKRPFVRNGSSDGNGFTARLVEYQLVSGRQATCR